MWPKETETQRDRHEVLAHYRRQQSFMEKLLSNTNLNYSHSRIDSLQERKWGRGRERRGGGGRERGGRRGRGGRGLTGGRNIYTVAVSQWSCLTVLTQGCFHCNIALTGKNNQHDWEIISNMGASNYKASVTTSTSIEQNRTSVRDL